MSSPSQRSVRGVIHGVIHSAVPARSCRPVRVGTLLLAAALAVGGAGAGCGKPPPPTTAHVKASDMPSGGDWSGVFYSPLYGHLHLVKEGNSVSGKWRTAAGDKWGELHGEATGDLLKYKWVEHKIGLVGPGSTTEGQGYFKYFVPPDENANHEIKGEWGLDRSEVGNPWSAIRQRNMLPDPDSVKPDETEKVNVPDEWDSDKKGPKAGGGQGAGDDAAGDEAGSADSEEK
jgi:hypothetical protein